MCTFRRLLSGIALLALALALPAVGRAADGPVTVFAAASLRGALDEVVAGWRAAGGAPVRISYAGSSTLARQIERGAPADLFLSADVEWMDSLERGGHLVAGSRRDLLGNTLVLIAPRTAATGGDPLASAQAFAAALDDGRLAMARVATVPAGKYGRDALAHLGLWESAAPRVVEAEDVRQALMLVARGEAPLGVVYASDAQAEPRVRVVAGFPAGSHAPIVYPAAAVARRGAHPQARALLDWFATPGAAAVFARHGFVLR